MTKTLPLGWYANYALEEAKRGDPGPLIARLMQALQGRGSLSDGEFWFVIEALEARESPDTRARLRNLERWLIAQQVDGLIDEEGRKSKKAVAEVAKDRGCSPRKVRGALKAHGKPRRYRG